VVLNGAKTLEETIQSVINQTYPNVEYIIIDGNSTDGTLDIIKRYEDYIDYWVSEKDKGIYDAMNKGIKCSIGIFLGIINADDWYDVSAVYNVVNNYLLNDNVDIFFGDLYYIHSNTALYKVIKSSLKKLKIDMTLNHPTCFVKNNLYKEKLFNIHYKFSADYELMCYFFTRQKRFYNLNCLIAYMRSGGASYKNAFKTAYEGFKIQKRFYSLWPSLCFFLRSLVLVSVRIITLSAFPERILRIAYYLRGYKYKGNKT